MDKHTQQILRSFTKNKQKKLSTTGRFLEGFLRNMLEAAEVDFHLVTHRVKSKDSLQKKLELKGSKYKSLSSLTDLIGVRIIVYYEKDIDPVCELLESNRMFNFDDDNFVDKRVMDVDRFGYKSVHYIISLNKIFEEIFPGKFAGEKAEIQIRTFLNHAYADMTHDLIYKSSRPMPEELLRRMFRIAALLELADKEFEGLRGEVKEFNRMVSDQAGMSANRVTIGPTNLLIYLGGDGLLKKFELELCQRAGLQLINQIDSSALDEIWFGFFESNEIFSIESLEHALKQHKAAIIDHFDELMKNPKQKVIPMVNNTLKLGFSIPLLVDEIAQ